MSAEDGSSQPPPAPTEKAPALKPAGFSSFINKNPTGKKVAPKAARRRPGAAASAASTSKAPAPTPTASTAEAQPAQTETSPSTSTIEPPAAPQLPTPAATQELVPQSIPQTGIHVREPAASATESSTATTPPAPTNTRDATQQDNNGGCAARLSPTQSATPRPAEEELGSDRLSKRQRVEATVRNTHKPRPVARRNVASKPVTETSATASQSAQSEIQAAIDPLLPQSTDEILQTTETTPTSSANTSAEASASIDNDKGADKTPATDVATATQKPKPRAGRRKLPSWSTINKSPGWEEQAELEKEAEGIPDTEAGTRSRPTAKARGNRKTATPVAVEGAELQENEESEEEEQTAPRRPTAKARGKRKAASATVNDDGATVEPTPKKSRKTRKDKGTTRNKPGGTEEEIEGEGEEGEQDEATEEAAARPKKKAPRKKKATRLTEPGVNAEGADGEQGRQRKIREREPTPSDAEDQTIDPETTFMSNIASRNIRVGKLSERERKMREINWVEVKQRRVEERELAVSGGRAARNQVDEELARAGAVREELAAEQSSGPRFQMIDGQITLIQDSGNINREADADRMIELMEEVAEDDLTAPINSSSYMRDNKRFPEHFMVPGQGTRWGREATDNFYDALRRFGTDFAMINKCFPHSTRRSIKKKFNREEKEHPELIKEALSAPRNTDWSSFLADAGKEDDDFADVDRIKAELAELQKEADVLIKQAQDKAVEEKRQRRLAGAELTDDENPEGSAKENGKKKKKGKGKQVQFAQEENFEVVGTLDDDPNWGVE
jgi:transcription factor TFIIIB component B''